ncbi:MAG TPA: hypothetical protein VLA05_05410 [Coriobacteriia bacterium]|nr:hypothetical protein [Coriobacteriia bacterium]
MPRAGWCRECGEWVWIDPEGSCQNGHGPDCLENVHEQEDPTKTEPVAQVDPTEPEAVAQAPAREVPFGVGEFPKELRRFSWGAFMLPLFWGATYGSWQIMATWLIALASPLFFGSLVGSGEAGTPTSTIIGVVVLSEIVAGVARLWAGSNANRLLWQREATRLAVLPDSKPRFNLGKFASRQRLWALWGSIIVIVGALGSIPFTSEVWREYGLTYVGALMPVVWLAVEIVLGLWMDVRMRMDPQDAEKATGII